MLAAPGDDLEQLRRGRSDVDHLHVGRHVPVDRSHVAWGRPATSSWKKSRTTSEGSVITLLFMVKPILVTISERTGSFRAGP
jgi:hypothetical protein